MQERIRLPGCLRRAAFALIAGGFVATPSADAKQASNIILVPPTDLPELAQQTGDAMLLHETADGRTFLYVEQNQGARLAVFDVTDPVRIRDNGAAPLDVAGSFDFVASVGADKELVRFREGKGEAVLDLHRPKLPNLKTVQGLNLQGSVTRLGDDGFAVSDMAASDARPVRDYQVVDLSSFQGLNAVFDVKQVREELTKPDTGTTFLLTASGLYVVRRPHAELDQRRREEERAMELAGG